MPSLITSDNGVSSGSAGLKTTAASDGSLALQTTTVGGTATTAVTIDTSQNVTFAGSTSVQGITVGRGAGSVSRNTAVGYSALASNSTGAGITAVGYLAGTNTTGDNNAFVGSYAGRFNTSGTNNVALGSDNTVADPTFYNNTSGSYNTAIGTSALAKNTTSSQNTAVGYQAAYSSTTGFGDLNAFGWKALYSNTTGYSNTAMGSQALYSNTTANNNTALGYQAGYSATSSSNVFVGSGAGYYITSGAKNTIIGRYDGNQGGLDIRTASNYIVLSDGDGNPRMISDGSGNWLTGSKRSSIQAGQGCIFYGTGQSSGAYFTGDGGTAIYVNRETSDGTIVDVRRAGSTVGSISVTTTATAYNTSSDYRLKENIAPMTGALDVISQLKPCTYTWKSTGEAGQGFIAHELQSVVPQCVTGEKDATDEEGNPSYQAIDTSFLVATLTAAIKELKAEIDTLKGQA